MSFDLSTCPVLYFTLVYLIRVKQYSPAWQTWLIKPCCAIIRVMNEWSWLIHLPHEASTDSHCTALTQPEPRHSCEGRLVKWHSVFMTAPENLPICSFIISPGGKRHRSGDSVGGESSFPKVLTFTLICHQWFLSFCDTKLFLKVRHYGSLLYSPQRTGLHSCAFQTLIFFPRDFTTKRG